MVAISQDFEKIVSTTDSLQYLYEEVEKAKLAHALHQLTVLKSAVQR